MDWYAIGLSAIMGGLGAALGGLIAKYYSKSIGIACMAVFIVGFQTVQKTVVEPRLKEWRIERGFRDLPAFAAMSESDPGTFESVRSIIRRGIADKRETAWIRDETQRALQARVPYYVAKAADDVTVQYFDNVIRQMRELHSKDTRLCKNALTGGPGGWVNELSTETQEATLAILTNLIRSAGHRHAEIAVDAAEAERLLEPVVADIVRTAEDVALLQDLNAPGTDAARVCEMTIRLYTRILKLPNHDAASVLRYMMASSD